MYCGGPNEAAAARAARLLLERGYLLVRPLITAAGQRLQKKRQSTRAIGALLIEPVLACVIVGSLLTAMITRLITLRPQILSDAPPGGFASPFSLRASKEDTGSSAWPLPA